MLIRSFCLSLLLLFSPFALAFEVVEVAPNVYALVGDLGQRSAENLGHNMTSGFIVGASAVAVVDSGASRAGAAAIDAAIAQRTDKPVRWVINTGGQDHRWLGNGYFKAKGAQIVASAAAAADMRARADEELTGLRRFLGDALAGTEPVYPDVTFAQHYHLPLAGTDVELIFTGGGHTPGDIFVWLPGPRIVFAGDLVFVQRLLGIREGGSGPWLHSLEYMRDTLKPAIVIPGHGHVTDLAEAMRDSYDYLHMLRTRIQARIDAGAFDAVEAGQGLDQSPFAYLANYDDLSFRAGNAQRVAQELFNATP